jgi:hypothetical protein
MFETTGLSEYKNYFLSTCGLGSLFGIKVKEKKSFWQEEISHR